jgi:tetratricopeptide (TPR) repeat protein
LQGKRNLLGEDDPSVLETMEFLADTWRKAGKLFEAETLQYEVLAKRKELFGDCCLPVSWSLTRLAFIKVSQKKHIEAEDLWERGIQMQRTFVVEPDNNLLKNITNLACTKYRLGKLTDSEDLLQGVILCREQNGDGGDPELLNSLGCLATAKCELLKFDEAVDLQKRAVDMAETLYGYESAKHIASFKELLVIQAERNEFWESDYSG